jgi:hypothetical protein
VLEKTFYMDNPDEVVPEKFVGCTIDWAAGKDTTGAAGSASVHMCRCQQRFLVFCPVVSLFFICMSPPGCA